MQRGERRRNLTSNMHAERASVPVRQNLEIAASLGGLDDSERVGLAGNGKIERVVARDLQEDACVRSALVPLAR